MNTVWPWHVSLWGGVKRGGFFSKYVGVGEEGGLGLGGGGGAVAKGGRDVQWREKVWIAAGRSCLKKLVYLLCLASGKICPRVPCCLAADHESGFAAAAAHQAHNQAFRP